MKKLFLLIAVFCFPLLLLSQQVVENGYHISYLVKPSAAHRTDSIGVYIAKGGFDINKNGKKEILMLTDPTVSGGLTSDTSNTLILLENDGNDNYKFLWSYKFPYSIMYTSYRGYGDIEVADMDKDGNLEIWAVLPTLVSDYNPNPPRVFAFEYDGTKLPDAPTAEWNLGIRDNLPFRPVRLAIDDVDGDNDPEIVTVSRRDNYTGTDKGRTLIIGSLTTPLEQNGLNVFQQEFIDTSSYLKGGGLFDMKITDFDGDGKKEIWAYTWDKLTINIYEAKGINTYAHEAEIRQAFNIPYEQSMGDLGSLNGACFYDANKDGKLESFIAGCAGEGVGEDGAIILIRNVDDVSKLDKAKVNNDWSSYIKIIGYRFTGGNPRGATVGDFDNDGKMDFAFVDRKWDKVVKMEYKGTGDLGDSTSYDWSTLFMNTDTTYLPDYPGIEMSQSDLDGDGYKELLLANLDVKSPDKGMTIVIEYTGQLINVQKIPDAVPSLYSLEQNYPNPFNPSTQIEFTLPVTSRVNLKIFNMLGQEVSTLMDEVKESGKYKVTFNANNLPSGTYFYRMTTDKFSASKRMILMR